MFCSVQHSGASLLLCAHKSAGLNSCGLLQLIAGFWHRCHPLQPLSWLAPDKNNSPLISLHSAQQDWHHTGNHRWPNYSLRLWLTFDTHDAVGLKHTVIFKYRHPPRQPPLVDQRGWFPLRICIVLLTPYQPNKAVFGMQCRSTVLQHVRATPTVSIQW